MRCDPSQPAPPHTRTVPRGGGGLGVVVAFVRGICSEVNGDFSVGVAAKEVCGGWLCCEEVITTRVQITDQTVLWLLWSRRLCPFALH